GRVGIMQITNPLPSLDEVWNWQANVRRGIAIFNGKRRDAEHYPSLVRHSQGFTRLVERFNVERHRRGLPHLRIELPDFTPEQVEEDMVRAYNGYGSSR